ncbi:hypothetical protein HUG10_11735 [Halorarum halophilum]|uniref:Uncharacterized protein n=1 Tax=Halorarum halophilum TaxID=2743090 RepID=A0A7D5K8D5_9EURY|nr:hypothetical protein [Halobaculum halophilum]QLG28179.1 hypothetical protein HUG10_11735 [Halobaculum halophilum]
MTLEDAGVEGHVSDHINSDRIVDGRPVDRPHICVYRIPEDDDKTLEEPHEAHDVVLRAAVNEDGARTVRESWGFFSSTREAARKAVDLAEEEDAVIWDDIIVIREPDEGAE